MLGSGTSEIGTRMSQNSGRDCLWSHRHGGVASIKMDYGRGPLLIDLTLERKW